MTPQNVIEAFCQKGENDCTTLAFIKAAIAKFGIDKVFDSTYDSVTSNYSVGFKNGDTLTVSKSDIDGLRTSSGFELVFNDLLSKNIWDYAQFCFGIFVNYYAKRNNMSITEALFHIDTKGINADIAHPYLGFKDTDIIQLTDDAGVQDPALFLGNDIYILCNFYHTVMASYDKYDEYGHPTDTAKFIYNHSSIFHGKTLWAYKFR